MEFWVYKLFSIIKFDLVLAVITVVLTSLGVLIGTLVKSAFTDYTAEAQPAEEKTHTCSYDLSRPIVTLSSLLSDEHDLEPLIKSYTDGDTIVGLTPDYEEDLKAFINNTEALHSWFQPTRKKLEAQGITDEEALWKIEWQLAHTEPGTKKLLAEHVALHEKLVYPVKRGASC